MVPNSITVFIVQKSLYKLLYIYVKIFIIQSEGGIIMKNTFKTNQLLTVQGRVTIL